MSSFKEECIKARELIYEEVKKELLGPGSEDISGDIEHELITDDPISRYSLGILFPKECKNEQDADSKFDIENNIDPKVELDVFIKDINNNTDKNVRNNKANNQSFDDNEIDEKISMANELKPSSMGFTFFAKGDVNKLSIRIKGAKYRESILKDCSIKYEGEDFFKEGDLSNYIYRDKEFLKLKKALDYTVIKMYTDESNESSEYKYFLSVVHSLSRQCKSEKQKKKGFVREPLPLDDVITINLDKEYSTLDIEGSFKAKWDINMEYKLQLCVFVRNYKNNIRSYTVVLCNNEEIQTYGRDSKSVFQPELLISTNDNPNLIFIENRDNDVIGVDLELDEEEQSLDLLYKDKKNYAVGHGVSTTQEVDISTGLGYIKTSFLPYYDVKGITFDMDGMTKEESVEILSMKNLSDYSTLTKEYIIDNLKKIVSTYNKWILGLEQEVKSFEDRFKNAALRHISECKLCSSRIEKGIDVLERNENAFLAFKLMNRALFMQRIQSIEVGKYKERFPNDEEHIFKDIDFKTVANDIAIWRPFQLAYILMCIESIVDPNCEDRDIVDLIWVPTGGGKTEAYLGLTAFTIFLKRIENKDDDGTTVIMRYTLRLLAAQQFIRASILICACELIRRENEKLLGKSKITIGIWIGSTQTPNTKKDAIEKFKELTDTDQKIKDNVFQVLKCPWCGTKLEKVKENGKDRGCWGYNFTAKNHDIFCTENKCPFSRRKNLPIEVIDEFIYNNPPTLLFGTVDKFAMITWKGEAASLFALNTNNNNKSPELIIQDELHLISGPLGSIVGQYETAIDLLCSEKGIRPKIIASTATIRRAKEQCNQLYVRDVKQFPPSGLSQDDSFFTKEDKINPGRRYVGVMPSGKTLTTTQVRLMSALTNRINMLDMNEDVRSEYWTLVGYFNTLKELGMTNSLINADIQENIGIVSKRLLNKNRSRKLYNVEELTSRRSSNDINNTLKNLEIGLSQKDKEKRIYPIDVLLSSNMISVGVDIPRLNLMMVLQQPKLTSEYIQATSRVGRKNPGIVFTLYNPSRSRDKSHHEMFYDYHQSFYKYVEPTSVTSFAEPAIDRMLHSVFIALVRHVSGLNDNRCASKFDKENDEIKRQIKNILNRVETLLRREGTDKNIIKAEVEEVDKNLKEICKIWEEKINCDDVLNYYLDGKPSLIKPFGRGIRMDKEFNTLEAMRNVDSQGKVDILVFEGDLDE
ncbi:DNA helicase [[Clostridium] sordellii]|uniref:helicase-related protein n=1 Tax=Paraclostridium sordellii TaxID=1505 RepID=UPI0005E17200|nr:helicase-related protein [Paeniclostridium sordellii]CEQ11809.1 DNA helicase [[Clostridium] sordellii] [Paeniclostridium sordellii]